MGPALAPDGASDWHGASRVPGPDADLWRGRGSVQHRRQGIGIEVVKGLIEEAARAGQALTLGVEKTNPALRLYERLGFRTTHEDDRKFYMQHDWRVPH